MRESELLSHIYERSRGLVAPGARVIVGPGDDCAVVDVGGNTSSFANQLLLKVDQVVEGRHFTSDTPIDLIARKAVARAISDIAAMGGSPMVSLCGAILPANYARANALFDATARWANHFGAPLVGGDISMLGSNAEATTHKSAAMQQGPLILCVTIVGRVHAVRGPVLRSAACVGDGVYVTGNLGNSFASGRHLTFEPRVREGQWLCNALGDRLHSMMDISDGLGRDAGRLAQASNVGIEIDANAIPRHADSPTWRQAASEGEDYELLFTASGDVPGVCPATGTVITCIGRVVAASGSQEPSVVIRDASHVLKADDLGWDHGKD
jgi:thiamine-monophosphate kinase